MQVSIMSQTHPTVPAHLMAPTAPTPPLVLTVQSSLPIVLFDLNGTLCKRVNKKTEVVFRPNLEKLKHLNGKYRVGVYSSMQPHNIEKITLQIEKKCNQTIFDRTLIFDRSHTVNFTEEELNANPKINAWKTKKCLRNLFENIDNVTIVDDELYKISSDEREHAIIVPEYKCTKKDKTLKNLVCKLCKKVTQ